MLFGALAWRGAPAPPDTPSGEIAGGLVIGLAALAGCVLAVLLFTAAHRAHIQHGDAGTIWSDALNHILFVVSGLLGLAVVVQLLAVRHAGDPRR